jgi:hypothetical protein
VLAIRIHAVRGGNLLQMNVLHDGPDNRDTARFCRKGINLIGTLSDEARKSLQWHLCFEYIDA